MRTSHLTFMAAGAVSAAVSLVALPALAAGATAPPPDPDAVRDAAASALVAWAAGEGITLADPACTNPAAPEAGQALTCYATDDGGATLTFLTEVPADGVWVFAERPGAPTPGVQPPEGYPGDTATDETIAAPDASAPTGEFTQAEGNASLTAPTPDVGPASNFASPVPLGEPADVLGGWTLTVNSVTADANADVATADTLAEPPEDGTQYVSVEVTMAYDGDPANASVVEIAGLTGDNTLYLPSGGVNYEGIFQIGVDTPEPGSPITGDVVFEVASDQVDSLVLYARHYQSFDAPYVFFATQ